MKARKVNDNTLDMVSKHVDTEDIYVTRTIEQSDQSLDEIIKKRYDLVICGGGDGTAMRIIEQMRLKVDAHNKAGGDFKVPKFGLLKMGTGNGWAGILNTPQGVEPIWTIRQKKADDLVYAPFNMMESNDGRMFHFGGFGVDALILNDYINMKAKYTKGFMWKMSNSLSGYLMAIGGKSLPNILLKGFKVKVRVINMSKEPIYKVAHSSGIEEIKIKKGETIYEGATDATIFGTTSDYGFKLRVMPFAMKKFGYFHLRSTELGAIKVLANLKDVWLGKYESPDVYDFLVKKIKIEVDGKAPFQLGGDPEGYRDQVTVSISDFVPEMLDFRNQ